MNRRIIVEYGKVNQIADAMNCTRVMVSKSLNYHKNSPLARKIRYIAVTQFDGKEIK